MRLNLKSIIKSQLMVIKAVEVSSTELNICYTNTKYSSLLLSVPMAEWLAYFPLTQTSRDQPHWALFYFSKNKLTEKSLKCACHSVDWMLTEWWLKCDWNPPFPSQFSRHSATIQSTERWDFILWDLLNIFQKDEKLIDIKLK